jgi:hypothetical protein
MESHRSNISGTVSGTTAAAYVEVLSIDTRGFGIQGKLLLIINNTQAAQTMKYKINGYAEPNSAYFIPIKAETSIAAATQVNQTDVDKGYAKVVVSVINDGGACTYKIDYTTY